MKLRFWQKTYLFTLLLFLVCLNTGVLSLTFYTNRKNVEAAETAALAERSYIALCLEKEFADLSPNASPSLLMQAYASYYGSKGVYLAFDIGETVLCSSFPGPYAIPDDTLLYTEQNGVRMMMISADVCDGRFRMVYGKNADALKKEFRALMLTYTATTVLVSVLLAICLYFILKKLSAPLSKLREATERIEGGDLSVRAQEGGSDEFAQLAKSFNAMVERINEQMETLARDAEQKQMLVDNMAHELRTPLTSIHGYAEFLEKAAATEEQRMLAAKYILSESERLQKISELLLERAWLHAKGPEMQAVRLDGLLADVAEKLSNKALEKQVSLQCEICPVCVVGNETLLSMLVYNLTENAIKACSAGGSVCISCTQDGCAAVCDNGKGMTKEQILHSTEPFYRTDKARSRADGGAGLGLALCKQIAQVHQTELCLESQVGSGTKVTVWLKVYKSETDLRQVGEPEGVSCKHQNETEELL